MHSVTILTLFSEQAIVKIMDLIQFFFDMLTLKALNVSMYALNVSMNQYH